MRIHEAVRQAGEILVARYHQTTGYLVKERHHLLSEADLELDEFLVSRLAALFPGDEIFSEESGRHAGATGRCWILDPIDGTTNFITGNPYFAVSVALEVNGVLTEGHVYNPASGEYFFASADTDGAQLNGQPIAVSRASRIEDSIVAFGYSANMEIITDYYRTWKRVFDTCTKGVPWTAPALSICNVARGRVEAFIDTGCSMQGQAAAAFILAKAGGVSYDTGFSPYSHRTKGGIFCCPRILDALRAHCCPEAGRTA